MMSKTLAVVAGILALAAGLIHLIEWSLHMFLLENVNWEGPFQTLADTIWLLTPLLLAGAALCLAGAILTLPQNTNS